jgi:hypothetical protein
MEVTNVRLTLRETLVLAAVLYLAACSQPQSADTGTSTGTPAATVTEKAFVTGGNIKFDLDGGAYEIKAATDNHIRVTLSGTTGSAKVDVATSGSDADVKIKDTPHNNFHAIVEVPAITDVVVRLGGGELAVGGIKGNKDVESYAGNVRIAVGDPNDYTHVDAAVKAGDIDARPFGGSKSGLLQTFTWSGTGKYTLRAHLGAGNLVLGSE